MQGLTDKEVESRVKSGEVNRHSTEITKVRDILKRNIFTIFNLVNIILAVMVLSVKSYKNSLFIIIALCNTSISIINEIRAKKTIEKLKIISEKPQIVIRNSEQTKIHSSEIVKDDIIVFEKGSQIPVNAKILEGKIEVNESFITGESDNITKTIGEELRSGSFVVSGNCIAKVEAVGDKNFIGSLVKNTRKIKTEKSKLFGIMNNIVKYISYTLIPIGILLFLNQFFRIEVNHETAVTSTVAALISMIPEGLILLTSSVLTLSSIRLAKKRVLVNNLYSIETLARVDTFCLDKTGTLTTGQKIDGKEQIRKESKSIINFFKENKIDVKIISGDTKEKVEKIAKEVGIENIRTLDLTGKTKKDILEIAADYNIFAKVQPKQKRYIIEALKAAGKTVAMTGDGVNDILAMKEADCSIAIGDGTDAARNAATLVLLESNFSMIKSVIAEGRQTINNLERSTTLFLAKTTYASILTILFIFIKDPYPFTPIAMTLINVGCIGFPAFILALEPNNERIKNKFVKNIVEYSIPTGLTVTTNILLIIFLSNIMNLSTNETLTMSMITTFLTELYLIYNISKPLNALRRTLIYLILIAFVVIYLITPFREFFGMCIPSIQVAVAIGILLVLSIILFTIFSKIAKKIIAKNTIKP